MAVIVLGSLISKLTRSLYESVNKTLFLTASSSVPGMGIKAMFFGAVGDKKIQNALHRIIGKLRQQPFNALEITGIVRKRFLGVPYTMVSAHSRNIQKSCNSNEERTMDVSDHDVEQVSGRA